MDKITLIRLFSPPWDLTENITNFSYNAQRKTHATFALTEVKTVSIEAVSTTLDNLRQLWEAGPEYTLYVETQAGHSLGTACWFPQNHLQDFNTLFEDTPSGHGPKYNIAFTLEVEDLEWQD